MSESVRLSPAAERVYDCLIELGQDEGGEAGGPAPEGSPAGDEGSGLSRLVASMRPPAVVYDSGPPAGAQDGPGTFDASSRRYGEDRPPSLGRDGTMFDASNVRPSVEYQGLGPRDGTMFDASSVRPSTEYQGLGRDGTMFDASSVRPGGEYEGPGPRDGTMFDASSRGPADNASKGWHGTTFNAGSPPDERTPGSFFPGGGATGSPANLGFDSNLATPGAKVVLNAVEGGHYETTGTINGKPTNFMVDTGATYVSLSEAEADRLGIDYRNGKEVISTTANGQTTGHLVTLPSVRVGDLEVRNVEAVVSPGDMPKMLLGNSFLSHTKMTSVGGVLTLEAI